MVEEQSRRIEHEITKIVDDLDKSYLRKMQVSLVYYLIFMTPSHAVFCIWFKYFS